MGQSKSCLQHDCCSDSPKPPEIIGATNEMTVTPPEAEENVSVVPSLDFHFRSDAELGSPISPGSSKEGSHHWLPVSRTSSNFDDSKSTSSKALTNSVPVQGAGSEMKAVHNSFASTSKVTKRSRLEKTLHLHLDIDILRAVPLRSTLQNLGALWRHNPKNFSKEELQKVYLKSRPASSYDLFLSHTWLTPGWQKFGSMLLRHHWPKMVAGWFTGTLLAVVLVLSGVHVNLYQRIDVEAEDAYAEFTPWATMLGMLGAFLALLWAPSLEPECCVPTCSCFLDIACVHQTDHDLRERGVYGIGGWLSVSKELRLLWSPPYFSRLWCVFEVAAYRVANPDGKIAFQPVFVENLVIVAWICTFMITWFDISGQQFPEYRWLFLLGDFVITVLVIFRLGVLWKRKRKAVADLVNFNLSEVHCSDETFDRPFVYSAIKGWYGSLGDFTDFVRGPLREDLLADFSTVHLPFAYYFIMTSPFFGRHLDYSLAMWTSDNFTDDFVWSYFLAMGLSRFAILICAMKVIFYSVDYFAARESSWVRLRDIAEDAIIVAMITVIVWGHRQIGTYCYTLSSYRLLATCLLAIVTVILCLCLFISFRCSSRRQSDKKASRERSYELDTAESPRAAPD